MEIENKIVYGLERIAEVYKTLLWKKAKVLGASPIQIQLLLFIQHHPQELSTVSKLALEFDLTKPTVSDAIKSLIGKEFLEKIDTTGDGRSYGTQLTNKGKTFLKDLENFNLPLLKSVQSLNETEVLQFYKSISDLLNHLFKQGEISVQRMCPACKFYSNDRGTQFCALLNSNLNPEDIRLDCPEFEGKS